MRIPAIALVQSFGILLGVTLSAAAQPASPVTLKAADGTVLKATYYKAATPAATPAPGLVLLHQCNRDRNAWAAFATAAATRGYHVIAMDYRGFGESGGDRFVNFQQQGSVIAEKWPGDVDTAFDYLVAQPGVDKARIGAAGASCGVNQSVLLARRHPEVKTVMLLSGGVTPPAREYLRETPSLSVLAAASHDDGGAVGQMQFILQWSSNASNKLVEYKAAGHGTDMFAVEKGLQPLMLDWLDARLRTATQTSTPSPLPPTPTQQFWTELTKPGGVAKARVIFDAARKKDPAAVLFPEQEMNGYGYELLQASKNDDAIVVFQMNVEAYPKSANTYDSLSDAYLAAGKRDDALKLAEKALQVLAADTTAPDEVRTAIRESAERKIKELKKG